MTDLTDTSGDIAGQLAAETLRASLGPVAEAIVAATSDASDAMYSTAKATALAGPEVALARKIAAQFTAADGQLRAEEEKVKSDANLSQRGAGTAVAAIDARRTALKANARAAGTAEVNRLRASAPRAGFLTERPASVTSDAMLFWSRFPMINRGTVLREGAETLLTARNPATDPTMKTKCNWLLMECYQGAFERTAGSPERFAKPYQRLAESLTAAIAGHLNVLFERPAAAAIIDVADSLDAEFDTLTQGNGFDRFLMGVAAPILFGSAADQ